MLTLAVFLDLMKSLVSGNELLDTGGLFPRKRHPFANIGFLLTVLRGAENARFVDVWFANEINRLVSLSKNSEHLSTPNLHLRLCITEVATSQALRL